MLRRIFLSLVTLLALTGVALAQDDTDAETLFDVMGLPGLVGVMREEGIDYGETIARDLFPSGMTPRWAEEVSRIYETETMVAEMRAAFVTELEGQDPAPMLEFYRSDLGQRIVTLEFGAREAMLDPTLDAAAKEFAAEAALEDTPRFRLVTEFITANDLIEANVVGGLNSNYAFVDALVSGGAALPGVTADSLLEDVWAQEDDIRASTTEWLYAFLLLAYAPLSDEEVAEMTAFSQTPEGRVLTQALFSAFDQVFVRVSRDLGTAASGFVISQDL